MPFRFHRVLLTGANGMLGQAIVERLGSAFPGEVDLLATSRETAPRVQGLDGGYTSLDITDSEALKRIFQDFSPTTVIHCAAMSRADDCERQRDLCWKVNVDATASIAGLCNQYGSRIILLSTDFVFDGKEGPYPENATPAPMTYYGKSKLAAENAVRAAGQDRWAIVRTTLGFGESSSVRRSSFVTWLLTKLENGERVSIPKDQLRTPTYCADLADGVCRILAYEKRGIYNITGREMVTVFEFSQTIAEHFGHDPELIQPTTTAELHPNTPRPLKAGLLILKAESELGYRPRALAEALDQIKAQREIARNPI